MTNTQTAQSQLNQLVSFKQRDKFSSSAWHARGLNPSGLEISQPLTAHLNACADVLMAAVERQYENKRLKAILQDSLNSCKKSDYDTEEREFICDLYYELANIVGVDFNDRLNNWLYGPVLVALMKIRRLLKPERIVETLRQPCTKCETMLETHIMRKEKGIPETNWIIVKCNHCSELNLLSHGPNVKEIRFGNYQWFENLSMDDYTHEQAMLRLEQIKIFRKQ